MNNMMRVKGKKIKLYTWMVLLMYVFVIWGSGESSYAAGPYIISAGGEYDLDTIPNLEDYNNIEINTTAEVALTGSTNKWITVSANNSTITLDGLYINTGWNGIYYSGTGTHTINLKFGSSSAIQTSNGAGIYVGTNGLIINGPGSLTLTAGNVYAGIQANVGSNVTIQALARVATTGGISGGAGIGGMYTSSGSAVSDAGNITISNARVIAKGRGQAAGIGGGSNGSGGDVTIETGAQVYAQRGDRYQVVVADIGAGRGGLSQGSLKIKDENTTVFTYQNKDISMALLQDGIQYVDDAGANREKAFELNMPDELLSRNIGGYYKDLPPSINALVSAVTITGRVDQQIPTTELELEITTPDIYFNTTYTRQGRDISNWFSDAGGDNLPYDIIALIKETPQEDSTTLRVELSGIPEEEYSSVMSIKIPYIYHTRYSDIDVTDNDDVVVDIGFAYTTLENVVIGGQVGTPINNTDIVLNLAYGVFENVSENMDVTNWFGDFPTGLVAKIKNINAAKGLSQSMIIELSGTPEVGSQDLLRLELAATYYNDEETNELASMLNNGAKFDIPLGETTVTITGFDVEDKTYDGLPVSPIGSPSFANEGTEFSDSNSLEYLYQGVNGTDYTETTVVPHNAGSYTLTVQIPESDTEFEGQQIIRFDIDKKDLTIKPDDYAISAGHTMPVPEITFIGLENSEVGIDVTSGPALLLMEIKDMDHVTPLVNTNTVGTYVIVFTNEPMPRLTSENYNVTTTTGALTISPISSSSSSGGSSNRTVITSVAGAETIKESVKGANVDIVVEQNGMKVTFNAEAFGGWKNKKVQVKIETVDKDSLELSDDLLSQIGELPIYDIKVFIDGKKTEFESEKPIIMEMPLASGYVDEKVIAVFIDNDGNIEPLEGIVVDGVMRFMTNHLSIYALMYVDKTFDDIQDHWGKRAIEAALSRDVVKGKSTGIFAPNDTITRAEFTSIAVRYFGLTGEGIDNYLDVEVGMWYTESISIAKEKGILPAIYGDTCQPQEEITREEMMYILYQSLEVTNRLELISDGGDRISDFMDQDRVSAYAIESSKYLISRNIINGSYNRINPISTGTRAEAMQMFYNILQKTF